MFPPVEFNQFISLVKKEFPYTFGHKDQEFPYLIGSNLQTLKEKYKNDPLYGELFEALWYRSDDFAGTDGRISEEELLGLAKRIDEDANSGKVYLSQLDIENFSPSNLSINNGEIDWKRVAHFAVKRDELFKDLQSYSMRKQYKEISLTKEDFKILADGKIENIYHAFYENFDLIAGSDGRVSQEEIRAFHSIYQSSLDNPELITHKTFEKLKTFKNVPYGITRFFSILSESLYSGFTGN